jgi:cytochrome c
MQRPALETAAAIGAAAIAIVAVLFVTVHGSLEDRKRYDSVSALTGGDAAPGQAAITGLGCGACHEIPGITGAHGRVGPSLVSFGSRVFVGGVAPNTADNLVRWIEHPRAMNPNTAMPDLGIDEPAARDIAAYLYRAS